MSNNIDNAYLNNYHYHYNPYTKEWGAMIRGNEHHYHNDGVAMAKGNSIDEILLELELLHRTGKNNYVETNHEKE